jgi:hypothetical protein
MRRREFITFVGLSAVVWPIGALAHQQDLARRNARDNI